ncbi:uncharacterized protein Triagg1_2208 [Trichoderma aggressivum f. europaeum]|uniref:AB hydrolase-1 domain-containing protein n=1 Tax=Trichoderma aggressivum f. europaeum TaxID=173218 RepID=A0AAE1M3K7_9HYPO|nr:hypothetical protein Triagg1_2208 [Trichoderma aggressivum f. europaeum]
MSSPKTTLSFFLRFEDIPQAVYRWNPDAYDGDVMAGDLVALLDQLKIEQAIFAGGDVGGITVQKLAFLHPERLLGLVMFNTPILGTMMHLIHHDKEQQQLSKYSLKYIKHNPGDEYDLDHVVGAITDPEYRAEIKEYLKNSPEGGMFYFFSQELSRAAPGWTLAVERRCAKSEPRATVMA